MQYMNLSDKEVKTLINKLFNNYRKVTIAGNKIITIPVTPDMARLFIRASSSEIRFKVDRTKIQTQNVTIVKEYVDKIINNKWKSN